MYFRNILANRKEKKSFKTSIEKKESLNFKFSEVEFEKYRCIPSLQVQHQRRGFSEFIRASQRYSYKSWITSSRRDKRVEENESSRELMIMEGSPIQRQWDVFGPKLFQRIKFYSPYVTTLLCIQAHYRAHIFLGLS